MSNDHLRTLKIKTGIVRRLAKEKVTYEKEAALQQERVENHRKQGKDCHLIRKQEEVLQESLMMIPDCQRRLLKAHEDLKFVVESMTDLKETQAYLEAKKILEESETQLLKEA